METNTRNVSTFTKVINWSSVIIFSALLSLFSLLLRWRSIFATSHLKHPPFEFVAFQCLLLCSKAANPTSLRYPAVVFLQAAFAPPAMASGSAVVKAVLSGDTVVLMGKPQNGPPPELQLSLASLQAPKLARGPQMTDEVGACACVASSVVWRSLDRSDLCWVALALDARLQNAMANANGFDANRFRVCWGNEQPFAWQSREYLRNLVIGKRVEFRVDYKVAAINRDFGTIILDGENVGKAVVRHGWASVRASDENRAEKSPDFEELVSLQTQAQQEKIGIWTEDPEARRKAVREVQWSGYNPQDVFGRFGRTPVRAVIEFVRDGSSLRCLLVEPMVYIGFFLAGIQCPKTGGPKQGTEGAEVVQPEPFALQAKYFTEVRATIQT